MSKKAIILDAVKNKYSIPAINFESFDVLKALIQSAGECNSPLFTQTTEPTIEQLGLKNIVFMKNELEQKYDANVILHLDHGSSVDLAIKCIDAGYDSVMIDLSEELIQKNAEITKEVIQYAADRNVMVESEIGFVGDAANDSVKSEIDTIKSYLNMVKPDILAVAVGSSHGGRTKEKRIDFSLLNQISELLPDYPLVLHGSSGVVNEDLSRVSEYNICKINIETELRLLYRKACMEYYESDSKNIKIRDMQNYVGEKIRVFVESKFKLFGSYGKMISK